MDSLCILCFKNYYPYLKCRIYRYLCRLFNWKSFANSYCFNNYEQIRYQTL